MKVEEHNPSHFHWTMADNSEQSVFAFEREVGDSDLLFVYNMTPNFYDNYSVGCLHEGVYEELFNSDKDVYGGWNQYNGLPLTAYEGGPENRPFHLDVKLGSYAAMILKRKVEKKPTPVVEEKPVVSEEKKEPAPKKEKKALAKKGVKKAAGKKK